MQGGPALTDHPYGSTTAATLPPGTAPAPAVAPGPAEEHSHEHRRLLVGDLVVRRVSYRSVARVAWPFFVALYASLLAAGLVAWNLAGVFGWSPGDDDLVGGEVFWTAVGAGVVLCP